MLEPTMLQIAIPHEPISKASTDVTLQVRNV